MYTDLADAIESLKEQGYTHTFELGKEYITCEEKSHHYDAEDLTIKDTHSFDEGTDPASEATVYAIEANDGIKGTLIISYGKYVDKEKADLIDRLLSSQKD